MNSVRFLTMTHFDWIMVWAFVLLFVILLWYKKLPAISSWHEFFNAVNSRGGNIVLLGILSIAFFRAAMQMFYWSMDKIVDGKLSADNAILLAGVTFVTGSAFGGAFSSMLKGMTGESSQARRADGTTPDGKPGAEAPKP